MRREARRAKRQVRASATLDRAPIHRPAPLPRTRIAPMGSNVMYYDAVAEHSDYATRLARIPGPEADQARMGDYYMEPVNHYSGVHGRRELALSGARVETGEVMSYAACSMADMSDPCSKWTGVSHSDIIHAESQIGRLPQQYDNLTPLPAGMSVEADLMGHPVQQPIEGCVMSNAYNACGVPPGAAVITKNFYDDREMAREAKSPPAYRAFNDDSGSGQFPAPAAKK